MDNLEAVFYENEATFTKFENDRLAKVRVNQEAAFNKAQGAYERATADIKKP
jgi:hypothetical protein